MVTWKITYYTNLKSGYSKGNYVIVYPTPIFLFQELRHSLLSFSQVQIFVLHGVQLCILLFSLRNHLMMCLGIIISPRNMSIQVYLLNVDTLWLLVQWIIFISQRYTNLIQQWNNHSLIQRNQLVCLLPSKILIFVWLYQKNLFFTSV